MFLPQGTANYAYNGDELMKSEDTGGVTVTYSYDGDGQRIEKSNGTIYWYGLGGQVLDETNLSGSLTNEYVFFGGKRIARRDSSNNIFYYFADDLGTSREIVQSGQTTPCYDADFYPYGGEILPDYANSCATSQNYKFTGKERDAESGLDDFGARYYSSNFGRFVSADWAANATAVPYAKFANPQTLNLYSYVLNNPLTAVDTDGHDLKVAAELQQIVTTLREESPSFNAELSAYEGPNAPNLTIQFGTTPNDPSGEPTIGDTSVPLELNPVVSTESPDNLEYSVAPDPAVTTITISTTIKNDASQVTSTTEHEVGHAHDARTNTNQYGHDSQRTKETKGKTPHDDRPEEKRANDFKNTVQKEVKQYKKEHKGDQNQGN